MYYLQIRVILLLSVELLPLEIFRITAERCKKICNFSRSIEDNCALLSLVIPKENYALICARAETIVAQMKKETDNKP